jgi:hypothetical protein
MVILALPPISLFNGHELMSPWLPSLSTTPCFDLSVLRVHLRRGHSASSLAHHQEFGSVATHPNLTMAQLRKALCTRRLVAAPRPRRLPDQYPCARVTASSTPRPRPLTKRPHSGPPGPRFPPQTAV